MVNKLQQWARKRGYKVARGGIGLVEEVGDRFVHLKNEGLLSAEFLANQMSWVFEPLKTTAGNTKSIIIVAVPRPAHVVSFHIDGEEIEAVLPPTYVNYNRLFKEVLDDYVCATGVEPGTVELLQAPLKSLAARLGLVKYGRNNITYIPEFGSAFQLVGLITREKPESNNTEDDSHLKQAQECRECMVCVKACPTGAIGGDMFLLRVKRCVVLYNENKDAWPDWLLPRLDRCFSLHSCLVGCLACQAVCPMNAGGIAMEASGITFSEAETEWLLAGKTENGDKVGERVREKMDILGMPHYLSVFGRNLRVLYQARKSGSGGR
jgi:epoxyqueuosine reductase